MYFAFFTVLVAPCICKFLEAVSHIDGFMGPGFLLSRDIFHNAPNS